MAKMKMVRTVPIPALIGSVFLSNCRNAADKLLTHELFSAIFAVPISCHDGYFLKMCLITGITGECMSSNVIEQYLASLVARGVSVSTQRAARSDLAIFRRCWETTRQRS